MIKRRLKYTTISIPNYVKRKLESLGSKGETWENLLLKIIQEYEEYQKMKDRFKW